MSWAGTALRAGTRRYSIKYSAVTDITSTFELTWLLADITTTFELTWFLADITTTFELTWFLADTIPYIGTEILNFHCFCIMEMFLFSKSMIPDENSVKISRRIFLDRSQGVKCT